MLVPSSIRYRLYVAIFCTHKWKWGIHCLMVVAINPLTTNDDYDYSCHENLAACYQLAQSVLK